MALHRQGQMQPYHALPANVVIKSLEASVEFGLSDESVRRRACRYGPNVIATRQRISPFVILAHQFRSPIVYLLASAIIFSFYIGDLEESAAIGAVLILNAGIGFITELKAARSIEALRNLGSRAVRVRRDGYTRLVPAEDLVPGDIVLVEAGDSISSDLRLIEASNLAADESVLTGESVAVEKDARPVAVDAALAERNSMLFKGTAVTRGSGLGVVTGTGLASELGRVSQLVEDTDIGSSPLEKKLAQLSGQLALVTLALSATLAAIGIATGKDVYLIVESAVALAVAAIPEGLPIVATLALGRGMWRMAQQNALIERLSAVETLGATTVILTDKTGTLTENRMTVRRFWLESGEVEDGSTAEASTKAPRNDDAQLARLLEIAILCNDATLGQKGETDSGDPMELALLRAGQRYGIERNKLLETQPLTRKHAFDTARKMMATVHRHGNIFLTAVKGAPEAVLDATARVLSDDGETAIDADMRSDWLRRVDHLGHHGFRVIACATKKAGHEDRAPFEDLTLVGLIALEDPARTDVPHAIQACQQAGIRVVMVTGDHAVTARSIGRAIGLPETHGRIPEGRELARVIDGTPENLFRTSIFARVSPADKLDIVTAYQKTGAIVAMTGDGVNDAPALRKADIGVAMGMRGTDVAREAADMILLDDSFPTIVKAIHEGRVIFNNIQRFLAYLLSCNLSEVIVVGLAILSALPLPILPLQILYLNLVTDVFPAFALAMGEGGRDVLRQPPRNPQKPILGRNEWKAIVLQSLTLAAATFGALALGRLWLDLDSRSTVTVTFLTLAFAQLWHMFNMRRPRSGLLRNEITGNPWSWAAIGLCVLLLAIPPHIPYAAHLLHLTPPTPEMWTIIFAMSIAPLLAVQTAMWLHARGRNGGGP